MTSAPPDREPAPDAAAVAPPEAAAVPPVAVQPVARARHAVLTAVVDRPAATTADVSDVTGYSRPAVHRALLELEAAGLLRRQPGGSLGPGRTGRAADRWYPTEDTDPADIAAATRLPRRMTGGRAAAGPARQRLLLAGLVDALPAPGTPMPADLRRQWIAAADLALTLLYPAPDPDPDPDPPDPTSPSS